MTKAEFIEKYGEEAYKKKLEYHRKYNRKHYQTHKEKYIEKSRKYYQNHKENCHKSARKYYQNHKEKCKKLYVENAKRHYVKFGTVGRARGQVRCIETGEIFENSAEASRSVGLNIRAVCTAIHRNIKAGGYHWEYLED